MAFSSYTVCISFLLSVQFHTEHNHHNSPTIWPEADPCMIYGKSLYQNTCEWNSPVSDRAKRTKQGYWRAPRELVLTKRCAHRLISTGLPIYTIMNTYFLETCAYYMYVQFTYRFSRKMFIFSVAGWLDGEIAKYWL